MSCLMCVVRGVAGQALILWECISVCVCDSCDRHFCFVGLMDRFQYETSTRQTHLKIHYHLLIFMENEKKENSICALETVPV